MSEPAPTAAPAPAPPKLSTKQRVFVEEYLKDFNATQAAIRAGYSEKSARTIGPENLSKPVISRAIKAAVAERAMGADEALLRLVDHARSDMTDFITIKEEDVQISKVVKDDGDVVETTITTMRQMVARLDLEKAQKAGKLHLVRKYSNGPKGLVLELYDAQAALKHVLALAKPAAGDTPDTPAFHVNMTLEEWKAQAEARRAAAEQTMTDFEDEDGDDA